MRSPLDSWAASEVPSSNATPYHEREPARADARQPDPQPPPARRDAELPRRQRRPEVGHRLVVALAQLPLPVEAQRPEPDRLRDHVRPEVGDGRGLAR
ncbi:hypothetical protein HNR02_003714 [Amycolatopsis endophytica]|uniref:Uncharacterized protein n=1 Tax=Amycolatopsis endophytica TaxID=860233 RepID=A0A853B6N1_9PSEU|nr:hypothetical protein [Amycolatopsis endophytica]NYI90391.1 hypothetical protein [Amycolatopsis endophytica]